MMTNATRLSAAGLLLLSAASPAAAQPQSSDNQQAEYTLPTIEVESSADASAEGLSAPYAGGQVAEGGRVGLLGVQDVMETPYNFTTYTELLIEDQQATSVGDILLNDPAVRVARGFGNFQQVYLVRGLPVFSDDMTYNGLYGLLPRQYLASEFVERVQVLRGANAFLKGAAPGGSGLGGAVNVVPKRAANQPQTQLSTGLDGGSQGYVGADVSRRSEDGRYGVRVNAAHREGDTAVDGESRELSMAHIGMDYRGGALRVSGDLGYQYHLMDASQPNITFAPGVDILNAPDASTSIAQPWTESEAEDVFGTLRAEYDLTGSLTGWIAAGARLGEEEATFANPTVNSSDGDYTASRFDNAREDTVLTGETGLRLSFDTGSVSHRSSVAASAYELDSKNAYIFSSGSISGNIYNPADQPSPAASGFSGGDLGDPLTTLRTRMYSLALADQLSMFEERFLVTLGGRYQAIEQYGYDYDTGSRNSEYTKSAMTPTLGAVYRVSPAISLYANYIEGLVKGDTAPTTSGGQTVSNAGETLEPYVTRQGELGMKVDTGDLGGSLSLYQSRKPVAGVDDDGEFKTLSYQRNTGAEIMAYGKATRNVTVLGGVSYLHADVSGNEAIGSPDTQASLNVEWRVPQLPDLSLNSRVIHTSDQYADTENEQKVPSWTRLDLGARYLVPLGETRFLTVRARVENVTDSDYWASAGGYPGSGYLTVGAPRTYKLTATVDF